MRGRLHLLINNAGLTHVGPTREVTEAQWSQLLAVNLLAPIQLTRGVLEAPLAEGEAHIVNVRSLLGLVPYRKAAAYQTSKLGPVGFSQALACAFARSNPSVTAFSPGFDAALEQGEIAAAGAADDDPAGRRHGAVAYPLAGQAAREDGQRPSLGRSKDSQPPSSYPMPGSETRPTLDGSGPHGTRCHSSRLATDWRPPCPDVWLP